MDENNLELLELYMDMVEKQDEIIYRLSELLRETRRELQQLRSVGGFFEESPLRGEDEGILNECMEQYEEMKEGEV